MTLQLQTYHQMLPPSEGIRNAINVVIEVIIEEIHKDPVTGIETIVKSDPAYVIVDFSIESTSHSHIRDLLLDRLFGVPSLSDYLATHIASTANNLGFGVNGFVITMLLTATKSVVVESSESHVLQFQRLICEGKIDGDELKRLKMETEPCSICLEHLSGSKTGGVPTRLPCSHVFHDRCLLEWFGRNNTCPMCRRVVYE